VLADATLTGICLIGAYLLRFEGRLDNVEHQLEFLIPLAISVKLTVFFASGIYRIVWRYVSVADLIRLVRAVAVASLVFVTLVLMATRFVGISRTVFVLDFLLTLMCVGGARLLLRVFRETLELPHHESNGINALIIGAGDTGELLLREIRTSPNRAFNVVGFLDDDVSKHGARIHDVPVLGPVSDLEKAARSHDVEQILVAQGPSNPELAQRLASQAAELGLAATIVRIHNRPSIIGYEELKPTASKATLSKGTRESAS
jgi:FlaA1/EpsC-like NDP-sugar epimerase